MPKVVKKVASKAKKVSSKVVSKSVDSNQMMVAAVVVVATVLVGPALYLLTKYIWVLFLVPAVASFISAFMFKSIVGKPMPEEFRKETTTMTAVFAVVLAVLAASNLPQIGLDGKADTVLPIFMIIYMSVWAIVGVLVTVYLPLGMTVDKKK